MIAAMGPGGVGTGTRLGFSGIEQSQVLDAAGALGGRGVACLGSLSPTSGSDTRGSATTP